MWLGLGLGMVNNNNKSNNKSCCGIILCYNIMLTRSSVIAGRPCDAKACHGLLNWTWK